MPSTLRIGKRLFDLALSAAGLVAAAPIFAGIAIVVKCSDGGPVFFRQKRIGYRGRPFRIWKFRTMVPGADRMGQQLTVGVDRRITKVGHLLRKTKLDELPQLINVLLGEMSFVGPRPEVPRYVQLYTPEQAQILDLVPGITDLASIKYRDESAILGSADDPEALYVETILPDKVRLNLDYAKTATVWTDIRVIASTVLHISNGLLRGKTEVDQ